MTPTECVDVVEFLAARCPAMRMHENTPDAWYLDLAHHDKHDALEAVRRCSRQQSFVSLAGLLTEIDHVERARTGQRRIAALEAQIAAENPAAELRDRPVTAITTGQPVPYDDPVRADIRRQLRTAAHTRRAMTDAEVEARAHEQGRREAARRELEQVRSTAFATPGEATSAGDR